MLPRTCELYHQLPALNIDKVYLVHLVPAAFNLWHVNAEYGRRGAALQRDCKTKGGPVAYIEATLIYWRVIEEKKRKGYREQRERPVLTEEQRMVTRSDKPEMVGIPVTNARLSPGELAFLMNARRAGKDDGWTRDWLNHARLGRGSLPIPVTKDSPTASGATDEGNVKLTPLARLPEFISKAALADDKVAAFGAAITASQAARTVRLPAKPPVPNLKPKRKISFD